MMLAGLGGVLIAPLFQLERHALHARRARFASQRSRRAGSAASVADPRVRRRPRARRRAEPRRGLRRRHPPDFLNTLSGLPLGDPLHPRCSSCCSSIGRERGRAAGSVADEAPRRDHREGLPRVAAPAPVGDRHVVAAGVHAPVDRRAVAPGRLVRAGPHRRSASRTAIIFLSFVVVTGLGGMVSLAQATFVDRRRLRGRLGAQPRLGCRLPVGRVRTARSTSRGRALIGALAAAALGAIVVVIPVRRLGAVALAIGTFALAFVADLVAFDNEADRQRVRSGGPSAPRRSTSRRHSSRRLLPARRTSWCSTPRCWSSCSSRCSGSSCSLLPQPASARRPGRAMLAVAELARSRRGRRASPRRERRSLIFALSAGIAGFGGVILGIVNVLHHGARARRR